MNTRAALTDVMKALSQMSATPNTRKAMHELIGKTGIKVDSDLRPMGSASEKQLRDLVAALDARVVWKLAAKRALRSHGIV